MAETNGHAPDGADLVKPFTPTADAGEFDALLEGLFEPRQVEISPGRSIEVRPLMLTEADDLYGGGLSGSSLQRFMLAHCVYINGRPLGAELAGRMPVALANRLVPIVMNANGMDLTPSEAGEAGETDPKA